MQDGKRELAVMFLANGIVQLHGNSTVLDSLAYDTLYSHFDCFYIYVLSSVSAVRYLPGTMCIFLYFHAVLGRA